MEVKKECSVLFGISSEGEMQHRVTLVTLADTKMLIVTKVPI